MRKRNYLTIFILVLFTFFTVACGTTPAPKGSTENELYVDLHALMPTKNTVSTETSPALNVSRNLAAQFKTETGVSIRWALDRYSTTTDEVSAGAWYATAIRKEDVPVIGYTFGAKLQDRDYYLDLTDYLDEPNEYVPGNTRWRDLFPEYLFDSTDVVDAKGRVVSIPITLYPGQATAVYYNKNVIGEDKTYKVPKTYGDFRGMIDTIKAATGKTPFAPFQAFTTIAYNQWFMGNVLSPNYMKALVEQETNSPDFNRDGMVSTEELLKAVKKGYFNVTSGPNSAMLKEMMDILKDYYTKVLPTGWTNSDYADAWKSGSLPMMENGVWNARIENNRNTSRGFEYGMFVIPFVDKNFTYGTGVNAVSATRAAKTEYYAQGEQVRSPVMVTLNIMKDGTNNNPTIIANAIKFLKYITAPINNKLLADEQVGAIGAVIGAQTPVNEIADWMSQSFAKTPVASWPFGFTTAQIGNLNLAFSKWITEKPGYSITNFYQDHDACLLNGANAYIASLNIDTTGW